MSQLTDRLRALAESVTFSESEKQDIRTVARLVELAEAWNTNATQRNIAALSSHIKAMRLQ